MDLIAQLDYAFRLFCFCGIDLFERFFHFRSVVGCGFVFVLRFRLFFDGVGVFSFDLFYFAVGICDLFGLLLVEMESFFLNLLADLVYIVVCV
jgi:hypothetical protein